MQVLNALQVHLLAHYNHHPNPYTTHHLWRWRQYSLALLSCLARRDLFAVPRAELPTYSCRTATAVRAAPGGGDVRGASEIALRP